MTELALSPDGSDGAAGGGARPAEAGTRRAPDGSGRSHAAILIADDDARSREALRQLLEGPGVTIVAVESGAEIRTPIDAIIGMTGLALGTELTAEQRECLNLVKASGDSLLTIIDEILDFSKIEAGRLDFEAIAFSLRHVIADAARTLALQASRKGLRLAFECASDAPDTLVGDPARLRQVLVNLIGNGIKFTERGEVVLRVQPEAGGSPDTVTCHFTVTDTGIGIPRGQQQAVFEAFQQGDTSTTRVYGGTGLGLAISSRLVDMMRGRLWVESEPGTGSAFHFTAQFGVQDDELAA